LPTHLFVIIQGFVTQLDGQEVVAYQLAHQAVSDLIASNATFGALLFSDLSNKLSALSERRSQHELQSLTLSRVDEAFVRPAHVVDAVTDILSVVKVFQAQRTASVLVRDTAVTPPRLGIFTNTGLQRAILDGRPLNRLPVGELSNFDLIQVRPSDHLT
jgi:CBS domain-containing protein